MLFDVSGDGGLGFCHARLPRLLPPEYHGPLVVALDSNALIDLQLHGAVLLGDQVPDVESSYAANLAGLADLLHLWLLRDIRLVVTPRSRTDAKRVTQEFLDKHLPRIQAVVDSLAFQLGDWTFIPPSDGDPPTPVGHESGLPDSADRDLVLEAQAVGVHVFLTRDDRIIRRTKVSGPILAIRSPRDLGDELVGAGVTPFSGGTCGSDDCPYRDWAFLAPDTGKWGPLMALFGE